MGKYDKKPRPICSESLEDQKRRREHVLLTPEQRKRFKKCYPTPEEDEEFYRKLYSDEDNN